MPFLGDHHEPGEVEVDLRLEGRVALGLGERLAVEVDRPARAVEVRHRVCQVHEDRGPRRPRRSGFKRLLEQSDRAIAVACLAEPDRRSRGRAGARRRRPRQA